MTSLRVPALALVLVLCSIGEAGDGVVVQDEASALSAAKKAIRSKKGGVFVVRIDGTDRLARWTVWHIFTVEEVLKPYRNDQGAYFVPLTVNEKTPNDGKSALDVGERYLLVTRMRWAAWSPLYVEKAIHLGAADRTALLKKIRDEAKEHAEYGSSRYLKSEQGGELAALEVSGVQTPHANGLVDPEPFGVTRDGVREAVKAGMKVLLVHFVDSRPKNRFPEDLHAEVLEDLGGGKAGKSMWVHDPESLDDKIARSRKMLAPYRVPKVLPRRRYVVVVDPRAGGLAVIKHLVPVIHEDGPTVRKIRTWLREGARSDDKPSK